MLDEIVRDGARQMLAAALQAGIRVPVGATLVRSSVPEQEVAETHAKAAGVLRAIGVLPVPPVDGGKHNAPVSLADHPGVAEALAGRNRALARFWLDAQVDQPLPALAEGAPPAAGIGRGTRRRPGRHRAA